MCPGAGNAVADTSTVVGSTTVANVGTSTKGTFCQRIPKLTAGLLRFSTPACRIGVKEGEKDITGQGASREPRKCQ